MGKERDVERCKVEEEKGRERGRKSERGEMRFEIK